MATEIDEEAERRFWRREGFGYIPTEAERQEWVEAHGRLEHSIGRFYDVLAEYARKRLRELDKR